MRKMHVDTSTSDDAAVQAKDSGHCGSNAAHWACRQQTLIVDTPSTFRQPVEPELIERFKRGDLAAFESIYRRFERAAWTLALRLTGRRDVAQEAL